MANRHLHINPLTEKEATNMLIQTTAFELLQEDPTFNFGDDDIPRGLMAEVGRRVNAIQNPQTGNKLKTSKQTVSNVITKMQRSGWGFVAPQMDRRQTRYNKTIFDESEQVSIRTAVKEKKLKVGQLGTQFSKKKGKDVVISSATARRILKRPLAGKPSMWPAVPKRMKIGGRTDHHRRCRLFQALWIIDKGQDYVDGMIMADESKMRFKINMNRQVDIEWVYRGEAEESNWYEAPRHPGQINLFLLISKNGIELHELYHKNMNKDHYKRLLRSVGQVSKDADIDFSCYLHDNLWRGKQPAHELNKFIGKGKWTQYMGAPCKKNHETQTYKSGKPRRVDKPVCTCEFPTGPVHAAYNPKTNLVEEAFAEIDAQIKRNHTADQKLTPPVKWIEKGVGKKKFWVKQLNRAIKQVGANKQFFIKLYDGYLARAQLYVQSRGKRLRLSKY